MYAEGSFEQAQLDSRLSSVLLIHTPCSQQALQRESHVTDGVLETRLPGHFPRNSELNDFYCSYPRLTKDGASFNREGTHLLKPGDSTHSAHG